MSSVKKTSLSFLTLIGCSLFPLLICADAPSSNRSPSLQKKEIPSDLPWLTGPLLTPSGHVIPQGHWNFEPYLFATTVYGAYDQNWNTSSVPHFYNINAEFPIQYGVVSPIDVQIVPQFSWNHTAGASEWVINDLPMILDIQLLSEKKGTWWPSIKLAFKATAPIGRFQKLDAHKLGTDISGSGNWNGTSSVVFAKLFQFSPTHYLAPRLYFGYTIANPFHVQDLNIYGGGKGTKGKVYPGNIFTAILGLEYTLSVRWALACDLAYGHVNKTRFRGKTDIPVGAPSNEQFSLAPAFEYNWSANVGLIAGAWFSFAGRNQAEFASGVIAVNIYK